MLNPVLNRIKYNGEEFTIAVEPHGFNMAIILVGEKTGLCELTKYQMDAGELDVNCSCVNTNIPFAEDLITSLGLGEKVSGELRMDENNLSDKTMYPVYKFNEGKLRDLDYRGYERYLTDYAKVTTKDDYIEYGGMALKKLGRVNTANFER